MPCTWRFPVLMLAILAIALVPLFDAYAQQVPPLGYKIGKPILPRPDLAVRILGFYPSGTPLPNGGQAGFGGGNVAIPIKVLVKNNGILPIAVPTQTKILITRGGGAVINVVVTETPPFPAGSVRTHGYVVTCPAVTNHIGAQATADAAGVLTESNEANNHATYSATVTVVH